MRDVYKAIIFTLCTCVMIISAFLIGWKMLSTQYVYDPDNFFAGLGIIMLVLMVFAIILAFINYSRSKNEYASTETRPLIVNEKKVEVSIVNAEMLDEPGDFQL